MGGITKTPIPESGLGDVVGPATSTDEAIARYDGATGTLLQDSSVTLTDAGVMAGASIDADTNTLTNVENADIKAAAAIAVDKLAALTASRAVASDGSGFLTAATTTAAELDFLSGASSNIQTQLDAIPAGADSQIQYNNSGVLAGSSLDDRYQDEVQFMVFQFFSKSVQIFFDEQNFMFAILCFV